MITLDITDGPTFDIQYVSGMNVQQILEAAYNSGSVANFSYTLQYYGDGLGYLVIMINETYETFNSVDAPFYFWELLVNGVASSTGIDSIYPNDGDTVTFSFLTYNASTSATSTLQAKYQAKVKS